MLVIIDLLNFTRFELYSMFFSINRALSQSGQNVEAKYLCYVNRENPYWILNKSRILNGLKRHNASVLEVSEDLLIPEIVKTAVRATDEGKAVSVATGSVVLISRIVRLLTDKKSVLFLVPENTHENKLRQINRLGVRYAILKLYTRRERKLSHMFQLPLHKVGMARGTFPKKDFKEALLKALPLSVSEIQRRFSQEHYRDEEYLKILLCGLAIRGEVYIQPDESGELVVSPFMQSTVEQEEEILAGFSEN